MAKQPKTYAQLSDRLGVSTRTIENWRERSDWPARKPDGRFDLRAIEAFCKRHLLGKSNPVRNRDAAGKGQDLKAATIAWTLERAENERIKKERQLVAQERELSQVLLAADVEAEAERVRRIISEAHTRLASQAEELLPEDRTASPLEWQERREATLAIFCGLNRGIADAVREELSK